MIVLLVVAAILLLPFVAMLMVIGWDIARGKGP